MEQIGVIIVAGGIGSRMGGSKPKQFLFLDGEPILSRTINNFANALPAAEIVVVLPKEYMSFWHDLAARFEVSRHTVVAGGEERFYSVKNGLAALSPETELIAVQDGVRPLGTSELIVRTAIAAATYGAAIPVVEPVDSFRLTDGSQSQVIDRHRLRMVQTPQIFEARLLRKAYETEFSPVFTDDASVVEHAGSPIFLCEGEHRNLKITTPEDLLFAEALLANEQTTDGDNL
ncbi:MAG: 2-C-methyl-D-erythritol 4-phosphate cytidylyltransferase [Alistipes sp.]